VSVPHRGTGPVTAPNQNPQQIARDHIDEKLIEAGWVVQDKDNISFNTGPSIAVCE